MNYEIYSYLCGKLQTRIAIISMATTIRETESGIRTSGKNPCHRTTELDKAGKNGADCYSKNGHAVTVLTRQS